MKYIPYGRQFIDKADEKLVIDSLSNDLITTGPFVKRFENKLKKYLDCKYAHVCNSGTSAIHLAMLSIGLKKGDVILMPAVNFISSYNMAQNMLLKVFLVDVDEFTGQITPNKILDCIKRNKLKNIKALIVMYNGGYPENSKEFYDLKKKYNFIIIEDACHALGAKYKFNRKAINIGSCKHADLSTFSLHPLKTITSGEGGVITTNNFKFSKNIQLFRNHGMHRNEKNYWKYDILEHGFNYRLSDINCALGLSQLNKINFILNKRKKISEKYLFELKNFSSNLKIPQYSKIIQPAFHLFLININFKKLKKKKDDFMNYLRFNNILAQQHYIPIYKFKICKDNKYYFPGSEKYYENTVSIPIFVKLNSQKQNKIIKKIKQYFK